MEHLIAYKAYVVAAALATLFVLERLFPKVQARWDMMRLARNASIAFINFLLGPFIVLPLSALAATHGLSLRPTWWNMALDLLLLDAWIYAWHRLNHVLPILWRFHEVHHLDETLDTTTALRFHFGEVVLSALVRSLLIWLLAIPLMTVAIFETLVVLFALFQHSNLELPPLFESWLSKLIVTPKLHWVHHHALREDTDSNYATMLSVWDILFRSRSPNARRDDMVMGVEHKREMDLIGLLMSPFRSRG
ncbi:MAG: sterol desaturase family protein [Aestuariivirga sp.]